MQRLAVWIMLACVALGTTMLCAEVEDELDPFDMVHFDHTNMKMRKKPMADENPDLQVSSPTVETLQHTTAESSQEEEKASSATKQVPKSDTFTGTLKQTSSSSSSSSSEATETKEQPAPVEKGFEEPAVLKKEWQKTESAMTQKAEAGEPCPALPLFKQFVSRLLRFTSDKLAQMDADVPTDLCLRLRLTQSQLEALEKFRGDQSRDGVFHAHDILNEVVQGVHVVNSDDPMLRYLWVEDYFGISLEKVLQMLNIVAVVVVVTLLLPRVHITWLMASGFLVSVAMTWYRLYKSEVAKQRHTLMKDLPAGCTRVGEGSQGFWSGVVTYLTSQMTFQQDECVAFYEQLLTHPSVMVTPMEALAVAVVQTLLKPLRTVGSELSAFLRALLKDLPVQWQLCTLLMVCSFVVLLLFLSCGYRLRVPFLMSIEPSHSQSEVKALRETVHKLQEDMIAQANKPASLEAGGPSMARSHQEVEEIQSAHNTPVPRLPPPQMPHPCFPPLDVPGYYPTTAQGSVPMTMMMMRGHGGETDWRQQMQQHQHQQQHPQQQQQKQQYHLPHKTAQECGGCGRQAAISGQVKPEHDGRTTTMNEHVTQGSRVVRAANVPVSDFSESRSSDLDTDGAVRTVASSGIASGGQHNKASSASVLSETGLSFRQPSGSNNKDTDFGLLGQPSVPSSIVDSGLSTKSLYKDTDSNLSGQPSVPSNIVDKDTTDIETLGAVCDVSESGDAGTAKVDKPVT